MKTRSDEPLWLSSLSLLGLLVLAAVLLAGVYRAYTHPANDFSVFYEAWSFVLQGRGSEVYHVTTDRFLYAPGFAWLLCPLGLFSRGISLGIWCFFKIAMVIYMVVQLSRWTHLKSRYLALGMTAWGVVFIARPIMIDFEYGQVNLLIVGGCISGLCGHCLNQPRSLFMRVISSLFLGFVAIAKLVPLPLLAVPWLVRSGLSKKYVRLEKQVTIVGVVLTLLIPATTLGWGGAFKLLWEWRDALLSRGLPLESHNQSFTALLYHYLSGSPTPVISAGSALLFGVQVLSFAQIELLSIGWTLVTLGVALGWMMSAQACSHFSKWMAILVGLLIVPSHLIWKPYFVFSIPAAIVVVQNLCRVGQLMNGRLLFQMFLVFTLFLGINFTSFDFVGHLWASHLEAASLLLILHLTLLAMVWATIPSAESHSP